MVARKRGASTVVPDRAVARILAEAKTPEEAMPEAIRTLCLAFGWRFGALWIFDPQADLLRCHALWGADGLGDGELAALTRSQSLPSGIGLPGRVWAAGEPLWTQDVTEDPALVRMEAARSAGVHAAIAFPVGVGGEPLGVLELFGLRIEPPDEEKLATMAAVGLELGQHIRLARAHEALRESEAKRAAIVDATPDAVVSMDGEGIIHSWNPGAARMFGYSAAQAIGRSAAMLVPADRAPELPELLGRVKRGERVVRHETVRLRKDGSRVDVSSTVSPILGAGGAIVGASVVSRDITDQRRSEEIVRRSEARYRSLVETCSAVVWRMNDKGETFAPSASWEAYTGQRYPGGLGWTWLDMIHADDRTPLRDILSELATEPRPVTTEVRVWNAASRRYRSCVARGLRLPNGYADELIGTLIDVDDSRRASLAARFLADATTLLAGSLDYEATLGQVAQLAIPDLADVCAVHLVVGGEVRTVAKAHRDPALSGGSPEPVGPSCQPAEIIRAGRTLVEAEVPCPEAATCRCEACRAMAWPCSRVCVPMHARGRTLGAICFARLGAPDRRFEPDDVVLCEEVARRGALAIDNAQLYAAAQRAAQAREEFITLASHELHTPLAPLTLAVQSLLKLAGTPEWAASPERSARLLGAVERSTARLGVLVDELLDLSKLSAERLVLAVEPMDLAAVVAGVLRQKRDMLAGAGCEVHVQARGETAGDWDRHWLETAVAHLLSNAAKYGRRRPIGVRIEGAAGAVRLVVRDEGCGIPPEEHARIFERFERAVSTRHYGGFGLGLWSVRRIIEAHGGSVRVESRVGEGAEFTVDLPRRGVEGAPRLSELVS